MKTNYITEKNLKKIIIVIILISLIAAYKIFNLDKYLTLDYLKTSREKLAALYDEHPVKVPVIYGAFFVLTTSLSLPGSAVLTLAGGALFGFWLGTLIVSFASAIGATMACLISRYLLRDWVQEKFGHRLSAVNQGLKREGKFYLFTLRMIPVFPFFVINLLMGLTPMPLTTYYWVSQLSMLPGTMVYVNAGKELAKLESVSGFLSPYLILSLALLGLFPLISKKLLHWPKTKIE